MKLSIIIVNWQTKKLLSACLVSIFANPLTLGEMEVLVVDNASTDGSAEMVKKNWPQIKLIANQKNLGFAAANNQAIKQTQADYYLLLNPDTLILPQTLDQTVIKMANDKNIGILGCKVLNPNQTLQKSVRRFPTIWSQAAIMLKIHNLVPKLMAKYFYLDFDYNFSQETEQVMGTFFLISRTALDKIGSLDENFFIWFEEVEYCYRAHQAGFKIWYEASVSIIHYGGQSFNQLPGLKKQLLFNRSLLHYWQATKNRAGWCLTMLLWPITIIAQIIIRLLNLKKHAYQPF